MQTNYTQPSDIVTYGGYSYVALTINQGANPVHLVLNKMVTVLIGKYLQTDTNLKANGT